MSSKFKFFPGDNRKYLIEPIPGDSKHKRCKCMNQVKNADGVLCMCSFEARADHLSDAIAKGNLHKCFPGKPIGMQITDFIKNPAEIIKNSEYSAEELVERLVIFIGKKNISLTVGASEELYDLLVYCFACGAKHGSKANPMDSAKKFIPHYKRDKLTELLIKTSEKIHITTMKLFSAEEMPYVSVSLDEGSTMSRKLLDFCLENPEYPIKSYPAMTIRMPDTTFESYNIAIIAGLKEIAKFGVSMSALVIDGGPGQMKSLNDNDPASLYNRTLIQWIKKLITIPCICHRVNNAFKSACTKGQHAPGFASFLQNAPARLNEHSKEIGATCPKHTETRWTCDYFIAEFINSHKKECERFIIIPPEFDKFYQIASLFYALIQIFEDPKCALSSVFPVIRDAIAVLENYNQDGNIFALDFQVSLEKYTINSKDNGIWALAYMFTPKGRRECKKILISSPDHPPKPNPKPNQFYVKKVKDRDAIDEVNEELIGEPVSEISDIPNELIDDNDYGTYEVEDVGKIIEPPPEGEIIEEQEISLDEFEEILQDGSEAWSSSALNFLSKALLKIGCPRKLIEKQQTEFSKFLYNNSEMFPLKETLTGHIRYDWAMVRHSVGEWRFLADLGLRLESIVAGEASCERTITAQRMILTAHSLRSDKKLLEARLRLLKGFE